MSVKADFDARLKRVKVAAANQEPDRVPLIPVMENFPITYGGGTVKAAMHDWHAAGRFIDKFYQDFKPDLGWDPILMFPAQYLETSGITWFRWPGKHLDDDNAIYQYVEGEYMTADEYPEMISDPTKFMMNKWIPRSFGNLSGFSQLDFRNAMWFGTMTTLLPFAEPEVKKSLEAAVKAAEILKDWYAYLAEYDKKMEHEFGVPVAYSGFAYAPFDMIGDSMRGTVPILTDLYENPDLLLKCIDVVTEYAIADATKNPPNPDRPWVWFWLHKGVDEFMSDEMFKKFYWPSLRKYITAVANAGYTPMVYVEGSYNTRLPYLLEVPKNKVVYSFETTDMAKAKKILGNHACIAGNIPNALLAYGTKQEVIDYCKQLIDTCAPGGGYMMDTGALVDNAKVENIQAMFEIVETYGRK